VGIGVSLSEIPWRRGNALEVMIAEVISSAIAPRISLIDHGTRISRMVTGRGSLGVITGRGFRGWSRDADHSGDHGTRITADDAEGLRKKTA
jgi:hypothetical protein